MVISSELLSTISRQDCDKLLRLKYYVAFFYPRHHLIFTMPKRQVCRCIFKLHSLSGKEIMWRKKTKKFLFCSVAKCNVTCSMLQ